MQRFSTGAIQVLQYTKKKNIWAGDLIEISTLLRQLVTYETHSKTCLLCGYFQSINTMNRWFLLINAIRISKKLLFKIVGTL